MAITRIGNPAIADQRGINFRNIIINGDMSIAQRSTSASSITSSGYHSCDRWQTSASSIGTWTQSRSTDVPTGQGFANSLKMDCTTADASPAASDNLIIIQKFEGKNLQYLKKGTSSAKQLTLSFWVKSNKTGTYIAGLHDRDNSRIVSKSYTISSASTWEKKTITFPADTTGALDNDNAGSLDIQMWLAAGSDFSGGTLATTWQSQTNANRAVGNVNLADSTSNEWYITGVQLEAGQVASDFEFLPTDVNIERCSRYFQKSYALGVFAGTTTNQGMISTARIQNTVSNRPVSVFFNPSMRTTPTITIYSLVGTSGSVSDVGTGTAHSRDETANVSTTSPKNWAYLTGVSGLSAGDGMCFHYTADAEL
jgi:hypothetical protein